MDSNFKFTDNTRVKLRPVDPTFYSGMAKTGNEGWIIKHRVDKFGLPEVFIRWDPDHWAYNEQPDCWTYEEHFDLAEAEKVEKMAQDDNKKLTPEDIARLKRFINRYERGDEDAANQAPEQLSEVQVLTDQLDERHAEQITKSQKIVEGAEAFFTVSIHRGEHPDAPMGELRIHTAGSSQSPETDALLGAQLSTMAASFHNDTALMNIRFLTDVGDDE